MAHALCLPSLSMSTNKQKCLGPGCRERFMAQSHSGLSTAEPCSGICCWQGSMDVLNKLIAQLIPVVPSTQKGVQGVSWHTRCKLPSLLKVLPSPYLRASPYWTEVLQAAVAMTEFGKWCRCFGFKKPQIHDCGKVNPIYQLLLWPDNVTGAEPWAPEILLLDGMDRLCMSQTQISEAQMEAQQSPDHRLWSLFL